MAVLITVPCLLTPSDRLGVELTGKRSFYFSIVSNINEADGKAAMLDRDEAVRLAREILKAAEVAE